MPSSGRLSRSCNAASLPCPGCPGAGPLRLRGITTENPAYIQGDFNANSGRWRFLRNASVATSVAADAITNSLGKWNDAIPSLPRSITPLRVTGPRPTSERRSRRQGKFSFQNPRLGYRSGIDVQPGLRYDGGVHNFLASWKDGMEPCSMRGSIVSLFYKAATATGLFQFGGNKLQPTNPRLPVDVNFLNPNSSCRRGHRCSATSTRQDLRSFFCRPSNLQPAAAHRAARGPRAAFFRRDEESREGAG